MIYKTAFGIQSNTCDGKHIFMYDCDSKDNLSFISKELLDIQFDFDLSNMFILETENGYNAFTLDKLEFSELIAILYSMNNVDEDFIKFSVMRKYFTLRMSPTKKIIDVLLRENSKIKSLSHYWFFNEIMNYNIHYQKPIDNNYNVNICAYPSKKHGFEIEKYDTIENENSYTLR